MPLILRPKDKAYKIAEKIMGPSVEVKGHRKKKIRGLPDYSYSVYDVPGAPNNNGIGPMI